MSQGSTSLPARCYNPLFKITSQPIPKCISSPILVTHSTELFDPSKSIDLGVCDRRKTRFFAVYERAVSAGGLAQALAGRGDYDLCIAADCIYHSIPAVHLPPFRSMLQGYLAHEKALAPLAPPRTLGIGLL